MTRLLWERLHLGDAQDRPTVAREYVADCLQAFGRTTNVTLLDATSQLVNYAIRNQRGALSVMVDLPTSETTRVTVQDDGPIPPAHVLRPNSRDSSIRALNAMGLAWGVGRGPAGRGIGIWAEA
ncbi:hypothetical protein [Nocardioides iriomotensis]|uniref:Uncharacterized protein n=1 Tax=Nocardioides iriomotensis TaxID=715784 RepID=A0A4Q5J7Z3_9ACTN|nr:hypothetical protein [Nocardioides iriomotensis]RYU14820.1 hypothetical protein ETU37_02190 [Nocardioides iriomotensis]